MADLIFCRRWTSLSISSARRSSTSSRTPPVSPDLTIAMYRSLNAFGNFAIAPDSDAPCSTSMRTAVSIFASSLLSICSARIARARRIGRPEFTMVANCREKIATSLSLTFAGPDVDLEVHPLLLLADLERGVAHLAEARPGPGARCPPRSCR